MKARSVGIAGLVFAVLWVGCAGRAPRPSQDLALDFLDSATFDERLSRALDEGPRSVTVRLLAPASMNEIPPRLDRWLWAVGERHGNRVDLEPEGATTGRSVVSLAFSLGKVAYEIVREEMLYRPARHYDAVVVYRAEDGRLLRLLFRRTVPSETKGETDGD